MRGYFEEKVKAEISSPTRALDTEYQNTTGRPLMVIVTVGCLRGDDIGAFATVRGVIGASSPPTTVVGYAGLAGRDNIEEYTYDCLVFMVPSGYYYMAEGLTSGTGSDVAKFEWTEVEL